MKTSNADTTTEAINVYRCPRSGWTKIRNRAYLPGDTTRDLTGVPYGGLVGRATLLRSFSCVADVEHWHAHMAGDPEGENVVVLIYRP